MKKQMARESYKTATCSALKGVYLFEHGPRIEPTDAPGPALQICIGNHEWITCLGGIPDMFKKLAQTDDGGRYADLPEDWGIIANMSGEVLYRATTYESISKVHYLGHWDGELATEPATIEMLGIGPKPSKTAQTSK